MLIGLTQVQSKQGRRMDTIEENQLEGTLHLARRSESLSFSKLVKIFLKKSIHSRNRICSQTGNDSTMRRSTSHPSKSKT